MSTTESLARFIIENAVLPCDTMEQLIGTQPSCTWKPGDPIANTKLERKTYGCLFESKLPRTADLENHVESLLNELRPAAPRFVTFPN